MKALCKLCAVTQTRGSLSSTCLKVLGNAVSLGTLGALIVLGVRRWSKEGRIGGPPIQPESPQLCQ